MDKGMWGNLPSPALTPPDHLHVPSGMARSQFRSMGTTISLLVPEEDLQRGEAMVSTLFADFEQTLSRFLPASELSQLNQRAGIPFLASELLFTVVWRALTAARATGGLYDPTLLNRLVQLGYDRTFEELPAELPAADPPAFLGGKWGDIRLDQARRLVLLPGGTGLDVGGIAKGMAVDAALERLGQEGILPALVNAGGDLAVRGVPPREGQWPIEVQGRDRSWVIPVLSGAVATSGVSRRHWKQGTKFRHHLLDPHTGLPADTGLWSVTVAAARCEQAEVAAKVALLLGGEQGGQFLCQHGLAGLLIQEDGTWTTAGAFPREALLQEEKEGDER